MPSAVLFYTVDELLKLLLHLNEDDKKNQKAPDKPKPIENRDKEDQNIDKQPPQKEEQKQPESPAEKDADKKYKKGDLLGSGSFGAVYKCQSIGTKVINF